MKTTILILAAFVLFGISGCNSNDKKITDVKKDTSSTKETKTITKKDTAYDADPTDTIPGSRYGINSSSKQTADLVRMTLKNKFKSDLEKNLIDSLSRKFIFFEYDLNDDSKKEIFVGLTGPYFCGTGGCSIMLLDNQGNEITNFTVSEYPVVIDNSKSKEWKDLFILSAGKYHTMKFDGKKYPSNPSVQAELKVLPGDGLPRALNYMNEPYPWFKF
ncbi:MAG: hypothetical protein WBQ38_10150 [Ignavibacteria bacterium]